MVESEILEHAWRVIERSESWTQTAAARDRTGAKVAPDDPDACCWCAIGAVEKAVADLGLDPTLVFDVVDILCNSAKELFGTRFVTFINDRQDHEAMRRLFAHAHASCEFLEPAISEDEPSEVERLRAMLGYCLGYIGQLERRVHQVDGCYTIQDRSANPWSQLNDARPGTRP